MASREHIPFVRRGAHHPQRGGQRLFRIADSKKSNLILTADHCYARDFLAFADKFGPYIVCLKTNIQLVSDLTLETVQGIQDLAKKHRFLIWEDHDYNDETSNAHELYDTGRLCMSDFCDFVSQAPLSGRKAPPGFGTWSYKAHAARVDTQHNTEEDLDNDHEENVERNFAFIPTVEHLVLCTEGVNVGLAEDAQGNKYRTPVKAVEDGCDFIICGKDTLHTRNPMATVKQYMMEGWAAYEQRIGMPVDKRTYPEVSLKVAAQVRPVEPPMDPTRRFYPSIELR